MNSEGREVASGRTPVHQTQPSLESERLAGEASRWRILASGVSQQHSGSLTGLTGDYCLWHERSCACRLRRDTCWCLLNHAGGGSGAIGRQEGRREAGRIDIQRLLKLAAAEGQKFASTAVSSSVVPVTLSSFNRGLLYCMAEGATCTEDESAAYTRPTTPTLEQYTFVLVATLPINCDIATEGILCVLYLGISNLTSPRRV